MTAQRRGRRGARLLALSMGALACTTQRPVVEARVIEIDPPALQRIAVAPFMPATRFRGDVPADGSSGAAAAEAAALLTRFVTEAFAAQGFEVIPADDLATLFESTGAIVPHGEPGPLARRAATEFGATALLVGTAYRYRERQGGELGATRAASVGFTVTLYAAPGARVLWKSRFDKTQPALSDDVLEARRYPGGGSRWLSAAQLARWGAEETAKRLSELR